MHIWLRDSNKIEIQIKGRGGRYPLPGAKSAEAPFLMRINLISKSEDVDYFKQLKKIANLYDREMIVLIRSRHPAPYDPNIYPWQEILTPIEFNMWSAIRALGLPFYPQFPVWKYHIDFADPILKIAIEVDGARFHSHKRDSVRTQKLYERNWVVYRIEGKNTFIKISEDEEGNEIESYPLDEFLKKICNTHYPHILF